MTVLDDALYRAERLFNVRNATVEPTPTGFSITDNRSEWLVHFVRNRRGKLSQCCHTRDVREVCLCVAEVLLSLFGCGDVHHRSYEFQLACLITYGVNDEMDVLNRPIRHQQSVLKVEALRLIRYALSLPLYEG